MAQQSSWKGNRSDTPITRRPSPVGNSLASLESLREIVVPERKPQVQPAPLVFEGHCNAWYKTTRNGVVTKIFMIEVRKDQVIFKDKEDDKHLQNLSLAKFVKFYEPV